MNRPITAPALWCLKGDAGVWHPDLHLVTLSAFFEKVDRLHVVSEGGAVCGVTDDELATLRSITCAQRRPIAKVCHIS